MLASSGLLHLTGVRADAPSSGNADPAFMDQENRAVAAPFDLADVRILGGIWKTNQDLDAKYILSLDPERLLHTFRLNAGLPSDAKPLGGWEEPKGGLRGHFIGHYLSACAEMYAATGDKQFRDRGTYVVTELGKCQAAIGTGYLSAFPPSVFDTLETKYGGVWAPYYTIHKIMAGLLDQYHACGNQQALEIAEKMADYFRGRVAKLKPEQIEKMLNTVGRGPQNEFGGMSEVLHNLYAITKKPEYLQFADVFDRDAFLNPLAMSQDKLDGRHANTHIPQVIGFARHYEITGDDRYRRGAEYFWKLVTQHHSYVNGSNSKAEQFMGADVEANGLSPDTGETCNVYNMLKLTQHLFSWNVDPAAADYYELALYNHILGSIDPDTGMTTYFMSLQPGHFKIYGTPETSFWCCTGTGLENHAKYGSAIYYHHADTLWVNLYIPSVLDWRDQDVKLLQETNFPQDDKTTLTIATVQPRHLKLMLHVPYWADAAKTTVKINGEPQILNAAPDSYLTLDRTWKNGDKIEYVLPMALHIHHAADKPDMVAIMYGPLVLAGDLGREGVPADVNVSKNTEYFKTPNPPIPNLIGDAANPDSWIKPVAGQSLTFEVKTGGEPHEIQFKPFYEFSRERYSVYWQLSGPSIKTTPQ